MRQWMIFGVGAAIGITIGVVISDMFSAPLLASGALGGSIAVGIATEAGWIKAESNAL